MSVERKETEEAAPIEVEIDLTPPSKEVTAKKDAVEIEHQEPDLKTVEVQEPVKTKEKEEDKTKEADKTVVEDDPDSLDPPETLDQDARKKWGERARKRFNKLTKQKHERDARIAELEATLVKEREQKETLVRQNDHSIYNAWHQAENRIKNELESGKNELKRATSEADVDAQSLALEKITKAQVDLEGAVRNRTIAENRVRQYQQQNQQQRQVEQAEPVRQTQQRQGPSEKAMDWADEHRSWFKKDQVMTAAALAISNELLEDEVDPESDDYFKELNSRLRAEFPHKFKTKAAASDSQQQVAGPTRAIGNSQTGKTKVTLTAREQGLARRLGLTLEQYAREKVRLNGGQ